MNCFSSRPGWPDRLSTTLLSNLSRVLSIIVVGSLLTGCGRTGNSPAAHPGEALLVAAAADLADVQKPLIEAFSHVGAAHVEFVLGSSGILARQIEQGAPYDVYLSANQDYIRSLAENGTIDPSTVRVYAAGRLGLWSRGAKLQSLKDLESAQVVHISMANPAHAPYGVAAREALERLGLWTRLEPKVVYGENVRQALQYAESGNAEAALTAWSLVHNRGGVLVPDDLHRPVLQSGGAVRRSEKPHLARKFVDFMIGPDGQRILKAGGFGPAPAP